MTETGSFGKSTRRSRSRTGTPAARRENPTSAAADKLFRIAGGVSLREDLPLERLWRDSQSAIHHVQNVQDPIMQAYGLDLFGHPIPASVQF